MVLVWSATTGSGLIVRVTVKGFPWQLFALTGTTVYTTFTGSGVMFVQASSAITFTAKFVPVAGFPAEGVNPFGLIVVIL